MKPFNAIIYNFNKREFEYYDIMPYLVYRYKESREKPKTHDDFVKFVDEWCMYQFWSRCEYELVLTPWPSNPDVEKKVDVYWQIKPNIDVVADLLEQNVKKN